MPDLDRNSLDTSLHALDTTRLRLAANRHSEREVRRVLDSTLHAIAATQNLIRSADVCLDNYGTLRHRPE
jgi:hypothetical protein